MRILTGLIFLPILSIGQTTFTGSVFNNNLNKVSYATIGLVKENVGVNADENGKFILTSVNSKSNDTLIISSVGYETLKTPIAQLPPDMKFKLVERQTTLKEVFVNSKRDWIYETLNKYSNCGTNYIEMDTYVTQVAQHFHTDTSNYQLSEIDICKYAIAVIDPDKCIFRLRIYAMDPINGAPAGDLTDSIIEVKTGERRTKVNLEKYKIHITSKDFYVAVEWLKIPYNASREKMKINGQKIKYTSYSPLIAYGDTGNKQPGTQLNSSGVWQRIYRGIWLPMTFARRLMISVTVKY